MNAPIRPIRWIARAWSLLSIGFLLLIGVLLTAEAFDQHVDKGYIYFAMGFAVVVGIVLALRARRVRAPAPLPV